ncbi:hypothetical protein CDAR_27611 [Caerostris darwini]|uniref:Uncharacterized protein n=1 Tax=Caerostris darwini TaxID=1538125 RepID=A0AAV4SRA9_9ARAC|nr:hypothetical protein CDAR_27611 [Caerostris darwini]
MTVGNQHLMTATSDMHARNAALECHCIIPLQPIFVIYFYEQLSDPGHNNEGFCLRHRTDKDAAPTSTYGRGTQQALIGRATMRLFFANHS